MTIVAGLANIEDGEWFDHTVMHSGLGHDVGWHGKSIKDGDDIHRSADLTS
jgi:hypothetical protein